MLKLSDLSVRTRYIILVVIVILVLALLFLTPLWDFVFNNLLTEAGLKALVEKFGIFGPVIFGLIEYLAILFFVPATIFLLLAGLFFGKFIGLIIGIIALLLSAATAFVLGRYFGKDIYDRLSKHHKIGYWVKKIEAHVEKNGFTSFFIMRCLFLPYILTSYASGMVRSAKLSDFILATLLADSIFGFMFVYLGDNLFKGPKALIAPIILILIVIQVPFWTRKLKLGKGW